MFSYTKIASKLSHQREDLNNTKERLGDDDKDLPPQSPRP